MENVRAQMETARVAFDRVDRLYRAGLASKGDLDTATGNYSAAKASFDAAAANVASNQAGIGSQQAQLDQLTTNLGYTKIYSPVDGVVVTRGIGSLGIDPNKCANPSLIIIADIIQVYPKEMFEKGIAVITSSVLRMHPSALSPRIKSLNYLNNILARIEANDAGVSDAIMLNQDGNVAEATVQNVFIVREGVVQTPTTHDGILEGVTRRVMIDICRKLSIPIVEKSIQRLDLYIADEMFLTGTGGEVMPVTKIDGRVVGNGEVGVMTKRLKEAFHKRTMQ